MTPSPAPTAPRTRRDIQGLRAIAVIAVVLCHAVGWPSGGFVGVDVFFVISGFLITGLLLREMDATGGIRLRAFAARRVRRILPGSLLVLVVVAVAAFFVFNRPRAEQTLGDAIAAALLASNWRFAASGTDYFRASDAVSPLQHFWSLSVEEQFYLVWPLLLVLLLLIPVVRRNGAARRMTVGIAAATIGAASFVWALVDTAAEPTVAYFSTATRAWELAAGALLAVLAPLLARIPSVVRIPLAWIGLAGILWSFATIDATDAFPAPWAALPVAATAVVIAAGVGGDPRARHLFPITNPVGVVVGDLSYALYLWHFPVIVFAAVLLPAGAPVTPIVLGAIATLAVASYLTVEQPLHRSPWLRSRGRTDGPAETPATPDAATVAALEPVAPAPTAPRALQNRPAGWTPGVRYYPGSPGRATSTSEPIDPAPVAAPVAPTATAAPATAPAAAPVPASSAPEGAATWSAWRARVAGQAALGLVVLVIGAGVIGVTLQSTVGGLPVIGPAAPPAASGDTATDPLPALQQELSEAVSATSWPALSPSLDDVISRSSSDNPARDCFSPDATPDAAACTWGSADAPNHLYLVGDSTAMAYAPAFKKIAEESSGAWRITTMGLYGCRFTDVLVQNDGAGVMAACPQRKIDVRAAIAADPAAFVVVSNAYTLGRTSDGADLSATDLIAATQAEMATYAMPGRIGYLAPPPLGADLGQCYSPLSSPANCLSAVDPTWKAMEAAAESAASMGGDHAIDSLPFSCWNDACPAFAGGIPTKYDGTHLTAAFAEHIAPVIRAALQAQGIL